MGGKTHRKAKQPNADSSSGPGLEAEAPDATKNLAGSPRYFAETMGNAAAAAMIKDPDADTATSAPPEPARKQQEAPLPELRDKHQGKNEYEDYEQLTAFIKGSSDEHEVDPNDVDQGSLGDCYFMASLAAVARANPDAIKKLITDNGDGTFKVTLYIRGHAWSKATPVTKTIDARLASKVAGTPLYSGLGDKADGKSEGWGPLLEKRLAQEKGSYHDISGGNISKGFNYAGGFELLTGKKQKTESVSALSDDEILLVVKDALDNSKPVTCGSLSGEQSADLTTDANKHNVFWNHAYAPMAVDPGAKTISLQNPWGTSHVENLSIKDFRRFYKNIRVGGAI
jgi:hypothetical protein